MGSESNSFEEVFQAHLKQVQRLIARHADNPEDVLDLTQEVFVRAYGAFSRFRGESSINTWLHRIATNVCIDAARSRARRSERESPDVDVMLCSPPMQDLVDYLAHEEQVQTLREALRALSPDQLVVLTLRFSDQLTLPEIAEVTDAPVETVRQRLRTALAKLHSAVAFANLRHAIQGEPVEHVPLGSLPVPDKAAAQIYHRLGSLYLRKGLIQAALQEWGKAQLAAPTFLDAYLDSAQQYVKMSKPDRAVETLEQAAAQVRDGDLHAKLGLLYLDIGDLDEGLAHSRLAVELEPSSPDAHYAAGRAYSRQAEIQEALRLGPASNLKVLPVIEPSWRDAAAHFQQAIGLNPDLAKARISLATAYLRQNMPDEAADAASTAAEASQDDAHILNQSGYVHYSAGRSEKAVDYLKRSIAIGKTHWKLNLLGCIYLSLKRYDEAVEILNEGLVLAATDWEKALIHSNLASAALGDGRIDDTIREAELAIELQFDHIHARCNLSSALLKKEGDPERIMRICREGMEFGPTHICFHGKLAQVLLRTGELDEALSEATIAIELEPEECDPWVLRAKILRALGRDDEARKDIEVALKLDPENDEANKALEDLRIDT